MRFTDKKGIKIYCCVSFSPCKVWIKCHTLACELLNELVCSLWCGACKYPSWVWNGDCLVGGGGSRELWIVGHIWMLHQQLGRSKGLEYQKALLTGCVWQIVADGKAPWWLRLLVIWGKEMIDRHSQNEMIDIHCQSESTHVQMQVWVERNVRAQICRDMRKLFNLGGV